MEEIIETNEAEEILETLFDRYLHTGQLTPPPHGLGLGLPLSVPTWGSMVNETRLAIYDPNIMYVFLWPTLIISITVFGFAMLGDGLRDLLDPKLR